MMLGMVYVLGHDIFLEEVLTLDDVYLYCTEMILLVRF